MKIISMQSRRDTHVTLGLIAGTPSIYVVQVIDRRTGKSQDFQFKEASEASAKATRCLERGLEEMGA